MSVYDDFLPLWDRKWLVEPEELWIFERGISRDINFQWCDELDRQRARTNRRQKIAAMSNNKVQSSKNTRHKISTRSNRLHIDLTIPPVTSYREERPDFDLEVKHSPEMIDIAINHDIANNVQQVEQSEADSQKISEAEHDKDDMDADEHTVSEDEIASKPKAKKKYPVHKKNSLVWVMNVGINTEDVVWSGEDIVDKIMSGEKEVVHSIEKCV